MSTTRNTDIRQMNGVHQMSRNQIKPRRFQLKKKAMLTVFMDYNGVLHHEFLPEGQTVNKEYYEYLGVMRRLREAIRRKRPELWAEDSS